MATSLAEKELQISNGSELSRLNTKVFGKKVGLMARIFGCWHKQLTRPFAEERTAYRACLECGARKPFDAENLKTERHFYYPPIVKKLVIE